MTWLAALECGHVHGPLDDQWQGPKPYQHSMWWCRWPCAAPRTVVRCWDVGGQPDESNLSLEELRRMWADGEPVELAEEQP